MSRRYALALAAGLIAVAVTILMGYLYLRLMGRVDGAWLL